MANIQQKRGSERPWTLRWREVHPDHPGDPRRTRKCSLQFRLKRDAEALLPVVEQYEPHRARWGQSYRDRGAVAIVTVQDLAVQWLSELDTTRKCKARTIDEYARRLERWRVFLATATGNPQPHVGQMSRELLRAFREDLDGEVTHNHANAIVTTVSQWWEWAWMVDGSAQVPKHQKLPLYDYKELHSLIWLLSFPIVNKYFRALFTD